MELIIYIILFILIIYINKKSIEHLTTNTKSRSVPMNNTYSSINQYRANYNPYFKSHLNNSTFDNVVPYNNTNPWILKDAGYSDIFNDELIIVLFNIEFVVTYKLSEFIFIIR